LLQLYHSVRYGYYDARTLKFLTGPTNALIEWLRLPGDALFILGGVLPVLYLAWKGVRSRKQHQAEEASGGDVLFREVVESGATRW
jgi:nitric oxide reductase subunit B